MSDSLEDGEIKSEVERLEREVREGKWQLSALDRELHTLQDTIHTRQKDRQKFNEKLFKVEEVEVLVSDTRQIKEDLSQKQKRLKLLKQGKSKEQEEVRSLGLKLGRLEAGCALDQDSAAVTEATVERLKQEFDQKTALRDSVRAKLEKVKKELSCVQSKRRPGRNNIDRELDKFILQSCRKAGLKLVQT